MMLKIKKRTKKEQRKINKKQREGLIAKLNYCFIRINIY